MSDSLTARQTQILKSLIDEYIATAEPVGSDALEKKYNLGVSPATIRNEMSTLTHMGYLRQPHTSAGRTPTPKAMKFYINQLMEEKRMSVVDEVKVREEVLRAKDDIEDLMEEATQELSKVTRSLAVAALREENKVWHAGYSNVFLNPEFLDMQVTASLFSFLEEVKMMHELFFERMTGESPVEVIFGEELGWSSFRQIGIVATHFDVFNRRAALGVIGPLRLSYPYVIPAVRYFRELIQEVCRR